MTRVDGRVVAVFVQEIESGGKMAKRDREEADDMDQDTQLDKSDTAMLVMAFLLFIVYLCVE